MGFLEPPETPDVKVEAPPVPAPPEPTATQIQTPAGANPLQKFLSGLGFGPSKLGKFPKVTTPPSFF